MELYDFIIQSKTFAGLRRDVCGARMPHALLLLSSDAAALKCLAEAAACALLCGEAQAPCQSCRVCVRVRRGSYLDCRIYPRGDKLGVDDINDLVEQTALRPFEGKRRVFVILKGETLNPASQNKLLKTLEEPPEDTVIIIAAGSSAPLLPTVLSRVRQIELERFGIPDMTALLKSQGLSASEARAAAAASGGQPGKALALAQASDTLELYRFCYRLPAALTSSAAVLSAAARIAAFKDVPLFFDMFSAALRDLLALHEGRADLTLDPDAAEALRPALPRLSKKAALNALTQIPALKRALTVNVSGGALVETFLLNLQP